MSLLLYWPLFTDHYTKIMFATAHLNKKSIFPSCYLTWDSFLYFMYLLFVLTCNLSLPENLDSHVDNWLILEYTYTVLYMYINYIHSYIQLFNYTYSWIWILLNRLVEFHKDLIRHLSPNVYRRQLLNGPFLSLNQPSALQISGTEKRNESCLPSAHPSEEFPPTTYQSYIF